MTIFTRYRIVDTNHINLCQDKTTLIIRTGEIIRLSHRLVGKGLGGMGNLPGMVGDNYSPLSFINLDELVQTNKLEY